jgi:NAD-specific glutamate dehydrogenase
VWQLAREANLEQTQAVAIYFACAQVTGLYEVLAQIGDATPQNRWEAMALHSLGQGMAYTLYRLAVRVAQTLGGKRAPTVDSVRAVLVDELKLGPLWDLANQIQAEAVVQIPALVVLTERLRARLR